LLSRVLLTRPALRNWSPNELAIGVIFPFRVRGDSLANHCTFFAKH
jgi:hypothetical protein